MDNNDESNPPLSQQRSDEDDAAIKHRFRQERNNIQKLAKTAATSPTLAATTAPADNDNILQNKARLSQALSLAAPQHDPEEFKNASHTLKVEPVDSDNILKNKAREGQPQVFSIIGAVRAGGKHHDQPHALSLAAPPSDSEDFKLSSKSLMGESSKGESSKKMAPHISTEFKVVAELAPEVEEVERERDELRAQLEEHQRVTIIAAEEVQAEEKPKSRRPLQFVMCMAILAVIIGLAVGLSNNKNGSSNPIIEEEDAFFPLVSSPLDGPDQDEMFGSSLSMNQDGSVLAVVDFDGVYIYRRNENQEYIQDPDPLLPTNCGYFLHPQGHETIRTNIIVDLSRSGEYMAIGCPFANHGDLEYTGMVQLYYDVGGGSWETVGEAVYGTQANDFWGATVSLSGSADRIAIGCPKMVRVMSISMGEWTALGNSFNSTELLISVGSVSFAGSGDVLAIGGAPLPGGDAVARAYRFQVGDWIELGNGINGYLTDTSYVCELSSDGNVLALSNYYVGNNGPAQGALNDALDVRAFSWENSSNEWQLMGENLHAQAPGEKAGYFISLSDDGALMGMGDPGRNSDSGSPTGHAHVYWYNAENNQWQQLGPNQNGEGAGDLFGFAVSFSTDGDYFAVAAPSNREAYGRDHGRVYVYDIRDKEQYQSGDHV